MLSVVYNGKTLGWLYIARYLGSLRLKSKGLSNICQLWQPNDQVERPNLQPIGNDTPKIAKLSECNVFKVTKT